MATLTELAESVKPVAERLAELEAEMAAAQRADDAARWLAAWNAREDLRAAQFLAESPPCPDDEPAPPAEDLGPADEWPAGEWDAWRCEAGPEPEPEPRPVGLALADALRAIAASYRAVPSALGGLLAEAIEDLLVEVEVTKARTVGQLRGRRAALLGAYAPRGAAPTRGRPRIDDRGPCGVLAGHVDRHERCEQGLP